MALPPVSLVLDRVERPPLQDVALGPAWVQTLRQADLPSVRLYRPQPTLAFSGRDCLDPGIDTAVAAAAHRGFTPVRRGRGGRAAAYHLGALGLDHVSPEPPGISPIRERFRLFGELLAGALQSVGVPAEVGEVPGEYCPGEFSVNDGRGHKIIGTAQRLVRGGWLFSAVILVVDAAAIRDVLVPVYQALNLEWDPGTVGAVEDMAPGTSVDDVEAAVLQAYSQRWELVPGSVPTAVVDRADELGRTRYAMGTG